MSALALSFGSPLLLLGLLTLPIIWWLLRLTPPKPKEEVFPPTQILREIAKKEETPAQSPWWLTLMRLAIAALIISALANPIWNANEKSLTGNGSLLVILDDTWASAPTWETRKSRAEVILAEAEAAERPVALVLISEGAKSDLTTGQATSVLAKLKAANPKPVMADYTTLAEKLGDPENSSFDEILLMTNGLEETGIAELAKTLQKNGISNLSLYQPNKVDPIVLTEINNTPEALNVKLERAEKDGIDTGVVTAFDQKGRSVATANFTFEDGKAQSEAQFILPVELRNEVTRVSVNDLETAGAVQLLDERFRRRRVGLISGSKADRAQPLLSPLYFIARALNPFSDIREADDANVIKAIPKLIEENVSTLILADIGTLPAEAKEPLEKWVNKGGMLVRFSGPRLASADDDALVPVELRRGGRSLGGTLTWGIPQPLSSFEASSPFSGIPIPQDVAVSRQVLAEPGIDLAEKTWASLADGTPLVTASQRGAGWIVLFHVTADASWSNLPLSGAFVDMLRRIVAVSNGAIAADKARSNSAGARDENNPTPEVTMPPLRILNGYGRLLPPSGEERPLKVTVGSTPAITLENPPGVYGTADAFLALNLFNGEANLKLLDANQFPQSARSQNYTANKAFAFKPWLLSIALLILALDCLAVLWMAGALRKRGRAAVAASFTGAMLVFALHDNALAQEDAFDFKNTLRTRIAYVITGDQQLDNLSKKGLTGLTNFIASRTSLEPAEPVGVDIGKDELSFYPLIYWPISTTSPLPDAVATARLDAFMKKGGSVLFDTRDQLSGGFGTSRVSPENQRLRQILASLDIPPLEPVPDNHVLTRAFYLLNVFPGRYLEGRLWVETSERTDDDVDRPARPGDGVSSIMITSNDMAAAWATEADGSYSLPTVPPDPRQRIYAYRTGVNIMMYTLTGNYKSDQVHIPALLERLGQ